MSQYVFESNSVFYGFEIVYNPTPSDFWLPIQTISVITSSCVKKVKLVSNVEFEPDEESLVQDVFSIDEAVTESDELEDETKVIIYIGSGVLFLLILLVALLIVLYVLNKKRIRQSGLIVQLQDQD